MKGFATNCVVFIMGDLTRTLGTGRDIMHVNGVNIRANLQVPPTVVSPLFCPPREDDS